MPFRVLSLDGGGIRGIIPALVLAELEHRSGRPIHEMFDLIAGTSTGGVLALGLTCPDPDAKRALPRFTARDLADLYRDDGERIFHRSVWHRVRSVGVLAEEKYPSDGLEAVLEESFGDARLRQALTPVLIPSYDLELRKPHFFKSHKATYDPRRDFLMRDAARATAAAPTYFEPARIHPADGGDGFTLVDGGVFANNPAACALVEAMSFFEQDPDGIVLLSLGTGEHTQPILYEDARGWGLARWAQPILDVVFDGVNDTVDYQVRSLLTPRAGFSPRYWRIQAHVPQSNESLDNADSLNIRVLESLGRALVESHDRELDEILARTLNQDPWKSP